MSARRAVKVAKQAADQAAEATAHCQVDDAKRALGERGPVWWSDGDPDLNRHMVKNTPYASWFAGLKGGQMRVAREDRDPQHEQRQQAAQSRAAVASR